MYMIEVELVPSAAAGTDWPTASLVQEVFWPLARREDRLEHLRARVGATGIGLVLFVGSTDGQRAVRSARGLCRRVSRTAPVLAGWTVARCTLLNPSA
ncbi:hypothetical protein ACX6XY_04230 [Streptomyces sp. O3]